MREKSRRTPQGRLLETPDDQATGEAEMTKNSRPRVVSRDGVPFCLTKDGELNIIALHCAMLEVVGRKKLLDQVADVYARMIEDGHP
jgi:hypothetical protein